MIKSLKIHTHNVGQWTFRHSTGVIFIVFHFVLFLYIEESGTYDENFTVFKKEKPNKKGVIVFGDIFLLRSRKTDAILLLLLWGWYNNKELQKVKTFLILRNIVQHIG